MRRAAAAAAALAAAALAAASALAAAPAPLRVGLVVPCGGPFAPYGDAALAAAQTALLERLGGRPAGRRPRSGVAGARAGRRPVRVVQACAEGPGAAVAAVARLRAPVVLAGFTGEEGAALARWARAHRSTVVVGGSTAAPPRALRGLLRFVPDAGQWVAGLATYAHRALGWRRAAVVADADALGRAQADAFTREFCAVGGTVVARAALPLGRPVALAVERASRRRIDGVLSATTGSRAAAVTAVFPGLWGSGARRFAVGTVGLDEAFAAALGAAGGGIVSATPYPRDAPAFRRYLRAVSARYPDVPGTDALAAAAWYAGGAALGAALAATGGETGAALRAQLARTRVSGPGGPVRLGPDGAPVVATAVVQLDARGGATTVARFRGVDASFSRGGALCRRGGAPAWTGAPLRRAS